MFGRRGTRTPALDWSRASSLYANQINVAETDEEVVLTFGVRPLPGDGEQSAILLNRVHVSFYCAKRLLMALQMALERHERTFGPLPAGQSAVALRPWTGATRATYANFFRVTATPEELTMDCGLNPNATTNAPFGAPIPIHTQLAVTFPTAKSLWKQLSRIVTDYEARHGALELDPARRASRI